MKKAATTITRSEDEVEVNASRSSDCGSDVDDAQLQTQSQ